LSLSSTTKKAIPEVGTAFLLNCKNFLIPSYPERAHYIPGHRTETHLYIVIAFNEPGNRRAETGNVHRWVG
jgi:hypothetical protein